MKHEYADWQVAELARLCENDTERAERVLNAVWDAMPGLFEELARAAGVPLDTELTGGYALVEAGDGSVARLANSRVAVWEVVREYRRSGSLDDLCVTFPSVNRSELDAAVQYAERNQIEVDSLIERYERLLEERRAQYPYATR